MENNIFISDIDTIEDVYYDPILRKSPLPRYDVKEIVDLIFNDECYYANTTLKVRYKKNRGRNYDIYLFKLIQPFDCNLYIIANSLHGGEWESMELHGNYNDYKSGSYDFIRKYIVNHITLGKEEKIEVDIISFRREKGIGCWID